jgi:Uma2 family endonuclease
MQEALKLENYTYDDYLDIDRSTQERVELINGKIYMMAGASALHQDTVGNIFFILKSVVKGREKCIPRIAPFDLKLFVNGHSSVVQPDVMLFCNSGLPCALFEVLSPSTAYKDKGVKKDLYESSGIEEYFLVNIEYKLIDKFKLIDGKYQYIGVYGIDDKMAIECLDKEIDISEVFDIVEESLE